MPNSSFFKTREESLEWYRLYRKSNRDKIRKYNREYNRIYRKKHGYSNEKKWKKNNPEKHRANRLAQYAIKLGYIKRKECEMCGSKESIAHHPDYTKPLDVIFLCKIHHYEIHLSDGNTT